MILHDWQEYATRGELRASRCECGLSRVRSPWRTWIFNTAHIDAQVVSRYRKAQKLCR